jgi:hypothetical protein
MNNDLNEPPRFTAEELKPSLSLPDATAEGGKSFAA